MNINVVARLIVVRSHDGQLAPIGQRHHERRTRSTCQGSGERPRQVHGSFCFLSVDGFDTEAPRPGKAARCSANAVPAGARVTHQDRIPCCGSHRSRASEAARVGRRATSPRPPRLCPAQARRIVEASLKAVTRLATFSFGRKPRRARSPDAPCGPRRIRRRSSPSDPPQAHWREARRPEGARFRSEA